MDSMKYRFFSWVTGHRKKVLIVFLAAAVICAALKPLVSVNYDMKDYLPEDSSPTIALDVMNQEYEKGVPNARLMMKEVSVPKALEYKKEIEKVDGVESVQWLDDTVSVHPSETPFYYARTLEDAELPWDVDIIYKLAGMNTINDAAGQLSDGAEELSDGAGQLTEKFSVQAYKVVMKQSGNQGNGYVS